MSGITPDTVTPDKLRASASVRNATWLPLLASCGPMLADAIEIADESSEAMLVCHLPSSNDGWLDTDRAEVQDKEAIAQAVRYLLARGLIEQRGALVRFKEQEAGVVA